MFVFFLLFVSLLCQVGYSPIAFVRTARSAVKMTQIAWKIGKATGGKKREAPAFVKANEMAELTFEPLQPFVVDTFKSCEVILLSFIVVRFSHACLVCRVSGALPSWRATLSSCWER